MRRVRVSTEHGSDASFDEGSAAIEFILVGLVLLVPLVYIVVALGAIQGQALGVETGSRQLARAIASAPDAQTADLRAQRVRDAIVDEYGLDANALYIDISCASAAACPEPGAILTVTMRTDVVLPLVPPIFGLQDIARIPVEAASVQKISRLWGSVP